MNCIGSGCVRFTIFKNIERDTLKLKIKKPQKENIFKMFYLSGWVEELLLGNKKDEIESKKVTLHKKVQRQKL